MRVQAINPLAYIYARIWAVPLIDVRHKNGKHIKIEIPWDRTTFLVYLLILLFVSLGTGFVESEDIQKTIAFVKTILP